jgi:hypothetical protein
MHKKSGKEFEYVFDAKKKKVGVILPIETYQKIKKFINLVEDDEDTELKLPKPLTWKEAGFDEARRKFKKVPNMNLDKTIGEDRDRF